ncbi:MAG: glycosyltransferase family 4 protein [Halioglobus sp.]
MVTTFYPPYHFGGDATYVRALSESLAALGHEVTVVHCEDAFRLQAHARVVEEPAAGAINVIRLRSRAGALSPLITQQLGVPGLKSRKLHRILGGDYDVVNFHNISLAGGPGVLSYSRAPVTIYTLHEHWLLCPTHIFWKNRSKPCDSRQCVRCCLRSGIPPQWWRYGPFIQRQLEHVDRFISPSEFTARQHREILSPSAPIEVIPLFSTLAPEPLGVEDSPPMPGEFIYVGRITASKGVDELASAFAQWPEYRLTLLGNGDSLDDLREKYATVSNVRFLGPVPQAELIRHYRRSSALILPSLAPETFGLTVVEAFACGTPAIVRAAGGNREAVEQSGAGFVYHDLAGLRSAIDALARDPARRRELGVRARAAFERHYTAKVHISRYLDLVEQVREEKQHHSLVGAKGS